MTLITTAAKQESINENMESTTGAIPPAVETPKVDTPKPRSIKKTEGEYFGQTVRIGSRRIQLKIVPKFNLLPQDPAAKALRDEVTKKVGSQWKSGSRDIIRGLSQEEEIKYLPAILGVKSTSDAWDAKVLEFWSNFSIEVPGTEDGIEFEAGFKISSTQEVSPIELEGYMKYNFCLANSKVANEYEDNLITYTFQMIDKAQKQIASEELYSIRKEVDVDFIRLVRSTDMSERIKIDWILELYGGEHGHGISIHGLSDIQKEMELEKVKNEQTLLFGEILKDSKLEIKSLLRRAVTRGELVVEGNTYFLGNKMLGDITSAIHYYNDPNNSHARMILVEKLKAN